LKLSSGLTLVPRSLESCRPPASMPGRLQRSTSSTEDTMVRKVAQDGGEYHEPPYTDEEWADIMERTKDGPIAWIIRGRHTLLPDETPTADQTAPEKKLPHPEKPE
jgi:hypothetical protein